MNCFMPGIYGILPLDESGKLFFEPSLQVGWVSTSIPAIGVTLQNPSNGKSFSFKTNSNSPTSFAWYAGGNIRINISSMASVNLNASYFTSKPEFTETYTDSKGAKETHDDYQRIEILNIGIGLNFSFY